MEYSRTTPPAAAPPSPGPRGHGDAALILWASRVAAAGGTCTAAALELIARGTAAGDEKLQAELGGSYED